jgi:hypothetical protein
MFEIPSNEVPRSVLTPDQITDTAWGIHYGEDALLKLKQLLCSGSSLKGYTPAVNSMVNREAVRKELIELQRSVCQMATDAGLDPLDITEHVHSGRG